MKLSREDIQKVIMLYLFDNINPDMSSRHIEDIEREAIDIDLTG